MAPQAAIAVETGVVSYDIFLSHNSAQKDWTRALARRLRDKGYQVFFDEWEMPTVRREDMDQGAGRLH